MSQCPTFASVGSEPTFRDKKLSACRSHARWHSNSDGIRTGRSDRYCLDEVQQANAITAGVREVAMMIMEQHLTAGLEFAIESKDVSATLTDLMAVLRAAMRTK